MADGSESMNIMGMEDRTIQNGPIRRIFSRLSRKMLILLGISVVVVFLLLFFSTLRSTNGKSDPNYDRKDLCLTPRCIHTASKLLEYMDESAEPCDNFYKFACGKFLTSTKIPDDLRSVDVFTVLEAKLREQLREILERKIEVHESRHYKLTQTFYQNCINTTEIKRKGSKPLLELLQKLGGWPVLEGNLWNEEKFDWKKSMYKFWQEGVSIDLFFEFKIDIDIKNSSKRVLSIDIPTLGIPHEYLQTNIYDKILNAYYDYMIDAAILLGANRTRAQEELKKSLEFEIELSKISMVPEDQQSKLFYYNHMTVKELEDNYTSIPWKEYFNKILNPYAKIDNDEVVMVMIPSYFQKFSHIIETTPKKTLANYIMWRLIKDNIRHLNQEIRNIQLTFETISTGITRWEDRWKECIDIIISSELEQSVGAIYVRDYFDEESKKSVQDMIIDIQEEYKQNLKKIDWMDEKTKKSAVEKIDSMSNYIAYPNELLDDDILDSHYESLEINSGDLIQSMLNLSIFKEQLAIRKFRKIAYKSEWIKHSFPLKVNARYSLSGNSIEIPAAILQGDFFHKDRPQYMNYGGIGFVIGHEITHSFLDVGYEYDKKGNIIPSWEQKTKEKHQMRVECIIQQYNDYTVEKVGLNLNGSKSQGENIADNGGIKESYLAYQKWVKQNGPEPRLPGLNYTQSQLFWLSTAHTWCTKYRPEYLLYNIKIGLYSPSEFRILGSFSNRPEFAKDFNCPVGSRMNPDKKCSLW